MRSVVIVFVPELIEPELLAVHVRLGRLGRVLLQGTVHPLVTPVLLGLAGFYSFRPDAELDPPDRQPAETGYPAPGERRPVVGHGQRIAPSAVACLELALVVCAPDLVRRVAGQKRLTVWRGPLAQPPILDEAPSFEPFFSCTNGRPLDLGLAHV